MTQALRSLIAAELAEPVQPRVAEMAAAVAALYPEAAQAVIFYGSCLRTAELDGQMLDFYLIVADYRMAYGKRWLAGANRLIPPNVFPFEHQGLAAKYAVLSEVDFHRLNRNETGSVSVWARFAQPSRLVWAKDERAREKAVEAIAGAAPTLLRAAAPLARDVTDSLELWRRAFALTYSAELRAERKERAASVVEFDPNRYLHFTAPAVEAAGIGSVSPQIGLLLDPVSDDARRAGERAWAARRRAGKWLSVLRLAKASFTFAGGIDYLAWKINRHAGTDIRIRPWQRKVPILAAFILLPRLLKGRAIR